MTAHRLRRGYWRQGHMSILHFYDLSRICTHLTKSLGLMCDGQCREMQNYLREQSGDIENVNMVEEIASFVYEFSKKQVSTTSKRLTALQSPPGSADQVLHSEIARTARWPSTAT